MVHKDSGENCMFNMRGNIKDDKIPKKTPLLLFTFWTHKTNITSTRQVGLIFSLLSQAILIICRTNLSTRVAKPLNVQTTEHSFKF